MPTCHETGIKTAIHQDDPPWDIFGLPRLLCDKESIDEYNCLCLCSGSLGANPENNVADIVRTYCDRIAFAHIQQRVANEKKKQNEKKRKAENNHKYIMCALREASFTCMDSCGIHHDKEDRQL